MTDPSYSESIFIPRDAEAQIADRTRAAQEGIPQTLAAIKTAAMKEAAGA